MICPKCCRETTERYIDPAMKNWMKKRDEYFKIKDVECMLDWVKPRYRKPILKKRYVCRLCKLVLEESKLGMGGGTYIRAEEL